MKKPPGTFRILGVGDSITFGVGVRFEKIYLQQLEQMLNQREGTTHFEVINMGVSGYNTSQELVALKEKGLQYAPDLVLVGFYWNDILGNEKPLSWEPDFVPSKPVVDETGHVLWATKHTIPKWLRDALREWRLLYFSVERVKVAKEMLSPSDHPYKVYYRSLLSGKDDGARESWVRTEKRLKEMVEVGEQNGFKVVIVLFPDGAQMMDRYVRINYQPEARQIIRRLTTPSLDLLPYFKTSYDHGVAPFLNYDNAHPSEAGHEVAARELLKLLVDAELVPST